MTIKKKTLTTYTNEVKNFLTETRKLPNDMVDFLMKQHNKKIKQAYKNNLEPYEIGLDISNN
ncbi:MAG: hypothetical protein WCR97_00095 [Bacilli bacterium]